MAKSPAGPLRGAGDGAVKHGQRKGGENDLKADGWTTVDMKADWKKVFAFEKQ